MTRRVVLATIAGAAPWAQITQARQRRQTIGYLYSGVLPANAVSVAAFRKGLAETGYIEGRNVTIEFREGENDVTRIPELVMELVRRPVDVIVVPGSVVTALAAKAVTTTIPIVFSIAGDPVQLGLVTSLSRPGGNVTGITDFGNELLAKRLELIKLLVPSAARVALLVTSNNSRASREVANAQEAARALGFDVLVLSANAPAEIDAAFATFAQTHVDAFCLVPSTLFLNRRTQIVDLASRYRLPGAYPFSQFTEIGGLMSYGSDHVERNHQSGIYAGLILHGRHPADLPVRRLEGFELAINTTTAKALGLTVPANFLALADKVIE